MRPHKTRRRIPRSPKNAAKLKALSQDLKSLQGKIDGLGRKTTALVIKAGEKLHSARPLFPPRSGWHAWVKSAGISPKTADRYMALAGKPKSMRVRVTRMALTDAYVATGILKPATARANKDALGPNREPNAKIRSYCSNGTGDSNRTKCDESSIKTGDNDTAGHRTDGIEETVKGSHEETCYGAPPPKLVDCTDHWYGEVSSDLDTATEEIISLLSDKRIASLLRKGILLRRLRKEVKAAARATKKAISEKKSRKGGR